MIDYIKNTAEYVRTEDGLVSASAMLDQFLFPPEEQYGQIKKLSGGEKRRLNLLRVLMEAPNVLILSLIHIFPISLTNLVIYFGLYILGTRRETVSYIVYLLIGLVGVPVFSGFTAGPAKMFGPTGGYLIGFIPMAVIAGIFIEKSGRKLVLGMIGMILGTAVCYIFGTVWFVLVMKTSVQAALTMCVYPFIVFDIIKMVLAAWIGPQILSLIHICYLRQHALMEPISANPESASD